MRDSRTLCQELCRAIQSYTKTTLRRYLKCAGATKEFLTPVAIKKTLFRIPQGFTRWLLPRQTALQIGFVGQQVKLISYE